MPTRKYVEHVQCACVPEVHDHTLIQVSLNAHSDAHFVARFVEALGHLRISTPSLLADVLRVLDRHLALEVR